MLQEAEHVVSSISELRSLFAMRLVVQLSNDDARAALSQGAIAQKICGLQANQVGSLGEFQGRELNVEIACQPLKLH